MQRRTILSALLGAAVLSCAPLAHADTYPSHAIRLVVPFAPGGGTDILARIITPRLSQALGQQVVVENKPGAASILGSQIVSRAEPDGYTLLMVDSGFMINPGLRKELPYDSLKSFAPVSHLATGPVILVAHPSLPANTVRELIALAKAKPGSLFFGSGGNGASTHLAGELFNLVAKTDIGHVPYNGTGPALAAVLANQVPITFTGISSAGPAVKAGKLKALAVTGAQRASAMPDVPTFDEAGLPNVDSSTHWQLLAPAGTPADVVQRLNTEINKILADPDIQARVGDLGYTVGGGTPQDLGKLLKTEIDKWAAVIKAANITMQ